MVNIDVLQTVYFAFDVPVEYQLKHNKKMIEIYPVKMNHCGLFNLYSSILKIDKNSSNDPSVISMSYLDFLCQKLFKANQNAQFYLGWILHECLQKYKFRISFNENNKAFLIDDTDKSDVVIIKAKEFEDIIRIILYQNILHYDDSYVDPELKKSMQEVDELRSKTHNYPDAERKFSIITAHCGLSKEQQLQMTMRSHQSLFDEVCGEVEFLTVRPIAVYAGKSKDMEHWIYKNNKGKFDDYIMSVDKYNQSMGGDGAVHKINSNNNISSELISQFNSFNQ